MTELLVTRMGYHNEKGEPVVDIFGRTEDGERKHYKVKGAESYFYVKEKPEDTDLIKRIEHKGQDLHNNKLWKITTKTPSDIWKIKDNYPYHYEADIPFTDRVRIDYKIKSQIEISDDNDSKIIKIEQIKPVERTITPEIIYFDIETMDDGAFPDPEHAIKSVVSVALYSTQLDKYFIVIIGDVDKEKIRSGFKELGCDKEVIVKMVKDEKCLFQKFTQIVNHVNPDVLTGWNVDNFDVAYMETRSKNQAYASPRFRNYAVFDLMKGYEKLHKGKTFLKLEYVSQKELGVGKLPRTKIHEMFKNDREKLCVYNLWDVELTRKIDIVKNIINFHLNLSWFAGCELHKTVFQEPLVDKYLLHEVNGVVNVPSKDMLEKTTGKYEGAYVDKPVSGKYTNVGMIDFASMYPRIILSCNLSVETKVNKSYIKDDGTTGFKTVIKDVGDREIFNMPSGIKYLKEPKGLIPRIVENLLVMRDGIKKEMRAEEKGSVEYKALWEQQRAVKYFTNAVYGVLGSNIFRLADRDVASDITNTGRILIKFTMDEVDKMGYKPLYADTDSVFFETDKDNLEEAVEVGLKVEKRMNELYYDLAETWNGRETNINEMKLEKVYQSWIQSGAKKRHIGAVGWDIDTDEKFITHLPIKKRLDIKGLDIVRSNVPEITKEVQEYILITALENDDYYETIKTYITNLKQDFFKKNIDTKMLIPASWSKEEYAIKPAHYRAMCYSRDNDFLDIQFGDAYSWVYVNSVNNNVKTDVFAVELEAESIPDEVNINYKRMWQRCIIKPMETIFESLGIDQHFLTMPHDQKSILDF